MVNPANGCIGRDTAIVAIDTLPPLAVALPPDTITCQLPSISLSGAGSSTGPTFSYLWTASAGGNIVSGDTTLNPVVNAAGLYTLLVSDTGNTCTATATVHVFADANAIVAVANAPDTLSCADTLVLLNAVGSSNLPGLQYAWTTVNGLIISGAGSPTPTVGAPGTYQLLLTNPANGCTATDQAIALQNIAPPQPGIDAPDTLTCAQPTQILQGKNTAPGGPFQYVWTATAGGNILSGDSTLTPLVNAAGTYTLTAINLTNGCLASATVLVAIEAGTPVAVAASAGPISCAQPSQTLSSAGSSTGPNFSYAWAASNGGNILSGQNSPNPLIDAAGNYALTITNTANGCTATASLSVGEDTAPPPADAGPGGVLTCTDPAFVLQANGGQPNPALEFSWQTTNGGFSGNPDSASVPTSLPGTYTLTVLNPQNGCTATASAAVAANQIPPGINLLPPATLNCVQATAQLASTATAPAWVFAWTSANGQFVSGQNSATAVVDAPGLYQLVVTDTLNGCTSSGTVTVVQNIAAPLAEAGPSPTLNCLQTQAVLQGSIEPGPGVTAQWSSINGNIVSGASTPSPTVDAPGDYLLLVTNTANGCTSTATVEVFENTILPQANAGSNDTLSCAVSSLSLSGSGSANGMPVFLWTASGGGNITAGANGLNPVVNQPGTYTLLVTDQQNGCTASDTVQIANDASAPSAALATPGTLSCTVTQLTLQGSGSVGPNFSQNWTASGGGNIVSGANSLNPTIDKPGTYTLTITNLSNGCTATAQTTVNQNLTPPATAIAPPGVISCATPSITLNGSPATAGHSYFWQTTGGLIVSGGFTAAAVVSRPGAYTLTVTSQANGCTASATVQVLADTLRPQIAAAAPQVLNCTQKQVLVSGAVSQPASGFSAVWTTANGNFVSGQNSLTPTVDAPGTYVLTVQNLQNGCTSTVSAQVQQNTAAPQANAGPAPTITCAQPQAGLDASGSSGQGALSFSWSGGQILSGANSANPTVALAAVYSLTVTDAANGCTATATVQALQNTAPPTTGIAPPQLLTCTRDTVLLDAGASSQGPNFTLNWTTAGGQFAGGQNSLMPAVQAPGTYTLTMTNQQNGCSATASATVGADRNPPGAEAGPPAALNCQTPQTALSGSSNASPAAFAWMATNGGTIVSGGQTAQPIVGSAGWYLLTVTDLDNGCTASDSVEVTALPLPAFSPTTIQPNCHAPKGSIAFGPVSGGLAPFRYSFDGGLQFGASASRSGLAPGAYALVVADALGCTATAEVTIDPPFFPEVVLNAGPVLEVGDSLLLEPALNLPEAEVAVWQWTPAEGLSCTDCPRPWARPLRPSFYQLTITDLDGCTATARVLVQVSRRRHLYAPNIFSPNSDGQNDRFLLFGRGVAEVQALRIFDRWGNQLFLAEHIQVNDEPSGWDGRFRGQDMNPGVYVWQAVVEFVDGVVEVYAGDVTLLR